MLGVLSAPGAARFLARARADTRRGAPASRIRRGRRTTGTEAGLDYGASKSPTAGYLLTF